MMNAQLATQPRIFAMMQGMASHGGIQRNSRTLCKMLTAYAAAHSATLDILSFTDPAEWYDERFLNRPIQGCQGNRLLFVAQALRALARPYDLVIVGQVDFGPIMLLPHLMRPRAPILTLTYGIEVWQPLPFHKRAGLHIADRVATISTYTANKLFTEQHIDPKVVQVIPCTMDPDFLDQVRVHQASGKPGIHTHLLTISRMSPRDADKGIDHVIAALGTVRQHVPHVTYTVIGDGEDRPRLQQLASTYGVDDIVHFVGRVSDAQMHAYLAGTDVFVLPSRKEGFGIVFLEAMAYGKPVIAGDHGGSPEVVVDGETGLLVQHGDQAALATAIIQLLTHPEQRHRMGEAGLRRVQTVYDYTYFQSNFEQILDDLLQTQNYSTYKSVS